MGWEGGGAWEKIRGRVQISPPFPRLQAHICPWFWAFGSPNACFHLKASFHARQAEVSDRFALSGEDGVMLQCRNLELALVKLRVHFWLFDLGLNTESTSWWLPAFWFLSLKYPNAQMSEKSLSHWGGSGLRLGKLCLPMGSVST